MTRIPALGGIITNLRAAFGVARFLRSTITLDEAQRFIREKLVTREAAFLQLLEEGVFANPGNPYLRLFAHAGIDIAAVRRSIAETGLETTLSWLYDAGIYVRQEEFKGRRKIKRDGLEFAVKPEDFKNPLAGSSLYEKQTSGTTGTPGRMMVNSTNAYEKYAIFLVTRASQFGNGPLGVWNEGTASSLRLAKVGKLPDKHFVTTEFKRDGQSLLRFSKLTFLRLVNRLMGRLAPKQELVRKDEAVKIARWLAEMTARGTPATMICRPSPTIRVCVAAREQGLDISGTRFTMGGEPYTPGKAAVLRSVGAEARVSYTTVETSSVGAPCGNPASIDEVHLLTDHQALIQKEHDMGGGKSVGALVLTNLLRSHPKIVINLESGDYADVYERDCGCMLDEMGYKTHLSTIRSYEKLTSEGVTFLGSRLYELVEEVLPARFGGQIGDYQIVEEEGDDGLTRVSVIVAPRVGEVDEQAVVAAVMETLGSSHGDSGRGHTDLWRQGGTVQVVRREPYESGRLKVMPLHFRRGAEARPAG